VGRTVKMIKSSHQETIKQRYNAQTKVHAACPSPCPCCMSVSMLHVCVHAACPCPCYMSKSVLHVHVRAACSCPCCMSMSMLQVHVYAACPFPCCMFIPMLHVHAKCPLDLCSVCGGDINNALPNTATLLLVDST
jgi:hypothetical protein